MITTEARYNRCSTTVSIYIWGNEDLRNNDCLIYVTKQGKIRAWGRPLPSAHLSPSLTPLPSRFPSALSRGASISSQGHRGHPEASQLPDPEHSSDEHLRPATAGPAFCWGICLVLTCGEQMLAPHSFIQLPSPALPPSLPPPTPTLVIPRKCLQNQPESWLWSGIHPS